MTEARNPAWSRHLGALGDELSRQAVACGVNLRDPGVIERVLRNDESVCTIKSPVGFRKLHQALQATYSSLNKGIERLGPAEIKLIFDEVQKHLDDRRAAGRGAAPAGDAET
jgi:hypothetical protein